MAIDIGGPGISGFGYGNQTQSDRDHQTPRADNDQAPQPQAEAAPEAKAASASETLGGNGAGASQTTNGGALGAAVAHVEDANVSVTEKQEDVVEVVPLNFDYAEPVPGYETSASDCLNHALSIARNLKHAVLSSDHLMLALSVDQAARRVLERVGDIANLQEGAMRRLANMHSKYSSGEPSQTVDLEDIRVRARASAAEREQRVSISDLVNAFPKAGDRLTYGHDPKEALLAKIETNLVPRVSDAMTRIEAAVREVTQGQRLTVEKFMQDLNTRLFGNEQSQREFMEDVHRHVREAAEAQAATLRELDIKVSATLAELESLKRASGSDQKPDIETPPGSEPRKYWSWIVL